MGSGHRNTECHSKHHCKVAGCNEKHHTLLHGTQQTNVPPAPSTTYTTNANINTTQSTTGETTFLSVLWVNVFANGVTSKVAALLDPGADTTLLSHELSSKLSLDGPLHPQRFGTFHGQDPLLQSFKLASLDGKHSFEVRKVCTVPNIALTSNFIDWSEARRRWSHLSDIACESVNYDQISLVIGVDVVKAHQQLEFREPQPVVIAPHAMRTRLGWCLLGPSPHLNTGKSSEPRPLSFNVHLTQVDYHLQEMVQQFWKTESMGTKAEVIAPMPAEEQRALDIVKARTKHIGGRYEFELPWSEDAVRLPNNYSSALRCFMALERRFRKDPAFAERYEAVINEYLQLVYAKKLLYQELRINSERKSYLPHHGVVHPNKPEKVRVVFNASDELDGVSLNSLLLTGPNLLNEIPYVLSRFRRGRIPVSADIKGMFHQVRVLETDQHSLLFLWRPVDSTGPIMTYKMTVQPFGTASSPFICSYILRRTADDLEQNFLAPESEFITTFTWTIT